MLLLLLALISRVESTSSCKSFPKIFGGNDGHTYLYQIDVYKDYLVMAGSTFDKSLTSLTSNDEVPYLALGSISTGSKYYWAKALT